MNRASGKRISTPFVFHLTQGNTDFLLPANFPNRVDQPTAGGRNFTIDQLRARVRHRSVDSVHQPRAPRPSSSRRSSSSSIDRRSTTEPGDQQERVYGGSVASADRRSHRSCRIGAQLRGCGTGVREAANQHDYLHTLLVTSGCMAHGPAFLLFYDLGRHVRLPAVRDLRPRSLRLAINSASWTRIL